MPIKSCFPKRPPIAEPTASDALRVKTLSWFWESGLRHTEHADMAKTVLAERKLAVDTSTRPKKSNSGFIIIPPPMPQIAPIMEAETLMTKKITIEGTFRSVITASRIQFTASHYVRSIGSIYTRYSVRKFLDPGTPEMNGGTT